MNNKKTFIIIAIIVALFLAGLFYFILTYDFKKVEMNKEKSFKEQPDNSEQKNNINRISVNNDKEDNESQTVRHEEGGVKTVDIDREENFTEVSLKNLASSFAERFGSYSNHSNYGNFKDLEVFMTDNMKEWARDFADKEMEKETANDYYGITTKAITTNIKDFNKEEGIAEVVIYTKRKESKNERSNSEFFNQKLTLDFVDQNGVWKVDGAFWEEK
jgi:hypothetical protein